MKIAYLVEQFPMLSEAFLLNEITGLIDRGHEVDIFAINGPAPPSEQKHSLVAEYSLMDRTRSAPPRPVNALVRALKGVALLMRHHAHDRRLLVRSLNVMKYGRHAAVFNLFYNTMPFVGTGPYDIVHCQFGTLGRRGMMLRQLGAVSGKLMVTFRGFDITGYVREHGEGVYSSLFHEADYLLTNCDHFAQRLIGMGCDKRKLAIQRGGVDCAQFAFTPRRPPADGRIHVVTTGRLVEKKGLDDAIRAVAALTDWHSRIEYQIIGEGPLRDELQRLIQSLGVGHIIRLVGAKTQEEIITILDTSHVFLAPCVTAANGDQDAPVNTLKEAMAMGLPVVSTWHGGIPELVDDGVSGYLVPERDAERLADRLHHVLQYPETWEAMGRAGRQRVEQDYNRDTQIDRLVKIYEAVLTGEVHREEWMADSMPASVQTT